MYLYCNQLQSMNSMNSPRDFQTSSWLGEEGRQAEREKERQGKIVAGRRHDGAVHRLENFWRLWLPMWHAYKLHHTRTAHKLSLCQCVRVCACLRVCLYSLTKFTALLHVIKGRALAECSTALLDQAKPIRRNFANFRLNLIQVDVYSCLTRTVIKISQIPLKVTLTSAQTTQANCRRYRRAELPDGKFN